MFHITFFLLLSHYLCTSSTLIKETIGIYCSDNITYTNVTLKLCEWRFQNGSHFFDTFDSALQDCPPGFELSNSLDFHILNLATIVKCTR